MAGKIRVLVVDDATVVRGMLSKLINAEPDMELAGSAADGKAGIERAKELKPDVIVLDIDMPIMTGLEALPILRRELPETPVIIFSTLSQAGAAITLDALAAGAADYSTKPSKAGSSTAAADQVRNELLTKIRGLSGRPPEPVASSGTARPAAAAPAGSAAVSTRPRLAQPVDALIIGSSTGGPAALEVTLPKLPSNLTIPILIVQHMPPTFTTVLAERLNRICPFPVHEAEQGMKVEAGHCYLAAGGFHMRLVRDGNGVHLALDDGPKIKSCRPSVDALFDSASDVYGPRLVATILTGMGDDGLDSCSRLAQHNVEIIVQDEETSVVWGMPGAVARAGLATRCLALDEIPKALLETAARRAPSVPRAAKKVVTS
ncbi:MAG: chemotaxis response regulator protein-glutamate methylesterase [Actinomycetota bacterium]